MTPAISAEGIALNLDQIRQTIARACHTATRDPKDVKLIAVSKGHSATAVEAALTSGQTCFGENRVQEAKSKFEEARRQNAGLELHLIGPLQTNKAKDAVALFDVIQTVDRINLAEKLADELKRSARSVKLFVQVNTGQESQKAGIAPQEALAFVDKCVRDLHLPIAGLMCIPPEAHIPAPHFALLAKLAEAAGLKELSMGMSADFEDAIRLGATCIRIGTAIFGARLPRQTDEIN